MFLRVVVGVLASLWCVCAPVYGSPITLTFDVTGTATSLPQQPGDATTVKPFAFQLAVSIDDLVTDAGSNGPGYDWIFLGAPVIGGIPLALPTDALTLPTESADVALTSAPSPQASSALINFSSGIHERLYEAIFGMSLLATAPIPSSPLSRDTLIALFTAGPSAFSMTSLEFFYPDRRYTAGSATYEGTASLVSVPEPATLSLLIIGAGVSCMHRRKLASLFRRHRS